VAAPDDERLADVLEELPEEDQVENLEPPDSERAAAAAVLGETAEGFHDTSVVVAREAERRTELAALAPLLVTVPVLDRDVNDLGDLLEVGRHLDLGAHR